MYIAKIQKVLQKTGGLKKLERFGDEGLAGGRSTKGRETWRRPT
jgi:hypothetical protein